MNSARRQPPMMWPLIPKPLLRRGVAETVAAACFVIVVGGVGGVGRPFFFDPLSGITWCRSAVVQLRSVFSVALLSVGLRHGTRDVYRRKIIHRSKRNNRHHGICTDV